MLSVSGEAPGVPGSPLQRASHPEALGREPAAWPPIEGPGPVPTVRMLLGLPGRAGCTARGQVGAGEGEHPAELQAGQWGGKSACAVHRGNSLLQGIATG